MATDFSERHMRGGEIGGIEGSFATASPNGDDTAKGGGAAEEGEEVGDEAEAGVVG